MTSNVLEQPLLTIKHTNVSRPQVHHTESQQSITASEDYYTATEISSDSDDQSQVTVLRFQTPPQSYERLASTTQLPAVTEARYSQEQPGAQEQSRAVGFDERSIPRKPIPAAAASRSAASQTQRSQSAMDSESLSTTPGVDDTPYIRFAIDQLTRDEEVRGSRKYPPGARRDDEYPVERMVPDEGLGYFDHRDRPHTPPRSPGRSPPIAELNVQRDIFVPYTPPSKSVQFPSLTFLPAIIRPLWLGIFAFLCCLMIAGLVVSVVWSMNHNGLLDYVSLGDSRYFLFQYLPTLLGMILLIWLHQIATAVQRISPFMALASESAKSRSNGAFLDLSPTQFLHPTLQHFRAGEPLIGIFFVTSWLFLFTIPLLGSSFNVRYYGTYANGQWRWVAVQGVIWTVVALYALLVISLILLFVALRRPSGLKWDARSLADIVVLLERSNIMNDYRDSEIFATPSDFRDRLVSRTDRLGYWHTSRRPNDIFYGIGEPGGITRRYTIEQGKIREKGPERAFAPEGVDVEAGQASDIRMDIRDEHIRRRHLPWFLKDTYVVAWVVTALILLLAFLIVSFVNRAVLDGFLPKLPAAADSAGFSASNFLFSFIPTLIATLLYLFIQTLDLTLRRLAPYAALSTPGGASAETSILLDYPARLPLSVTLAATSNRNWRVALFSFFSLMTGLTLPILAGGCFWTQYYPSNGSIRVAAHPPAYYALCVFLALYVVSLLALFPGRRDIALPHSSTTLADVISWLYQSRIVSDTAFSRPHTKAELVARLVGPSVYQSSALSRSLRNLGAAIATPAKGSATKEETTPATATTRSTAEQPLVRDDADHYTRRPRVPRANSREEALRREKRVSITAPGEMRYGFGIHVGRDGREHLGVDRVQRGEGRMMHFD